jgi:hypothetical protein
VTLQIVASLIDAARGVIYDRHMFIVQATGFIPQQKFSYFIDPNIFWHPGSGGRGTKQ